jgi:hypothetical protein
MALSEAVLVARARRAYERGRWGRAARVVPFVIAAAVLAAACGRPVEVCAWLAAAVAALSIGLGVAGGGAGRAVLPGLSGGSAALAMPLLVRTFGPACFGPSCMSLCFPSCIAGGAVAGVLIGMRARGEERGLAFVAPALVVAGLLGALGCTLAGAAGVVGMAAGAIAAGTPILIATRR